MFKRLVKVLGIILGVALCAYIGTKVFLGIHYICPIKAIFGIVCAGCGTTRMLALMFKLNFAEAFRYNQLMFILTIFFGTYGINNAVLYILKGKVIKLPLKFLIGIIVLLIIFMIVRNIPSFTYLRPPE